MEDAIVRRKWKYTPIPATRWSVESRLLHPSNGTACFCAMPEVVHAGKTIFTGGDIVLRYGRHTGNRFSQNGFGFRHIWARRFHHVTAHDEAMDAVCEFVAGILRPGAHLYWEAGRRVAIFCNANGEVIVEERGTAQRPFYSIVTAIRHPVKPKGSRLGALG
jgi:hypothetical protein